MSESTYPWYARTKNTDSPEQGDFLNSVPYVETREALTRAEDPDVVFSLTNVIVLSQSCDLINTNKLKYVQVAPVGTLGEFLKKNKHFKTAERLDSLRKNNVPRYHLLNVNRSNAFAKMGYLVVDFGAVFSIKVSTLHELCKEQPNRLTLLSPYKEQLSQQFARFYMRVGLPEDIPVLKGKWLK